MGGAPWSFFQYSQSPVFLFSKLQAANIMHILLLGENSIPISTEHKWPVLHSFNCWDSRIIPKRGTCRNWEFFRSSERTWQGNCCSYLATKTSFVPAPSVLVARNNLYGHKIHEDLIQRLLTLSLPTNSRYAKVVM